MKSNILLDDFKGWSKFDYSWLLTACSLIVVVTLMMGGSIISIISALANIICVVLVAQGKITNYLWGLIGVVTYACLSYSWGYYGETFLNIAYYLPMQIVGFYLWRNQQGNVDETKTNTVLIRDITRRQKLFGLLLIPFLIAIGACILYLVGGKLVIFDATTTVLSVIAMALMAARMKEQWYLWIIVNVISIYMWAMAYIAGNVDGIATLGMWLVFLLNSVYGLMKWSSSEQKTKHIGWIGG